MYLIKRIFILFAFYLANANADDIAELKNFNKNEKKPINEIYPKFIDWAKYGTNSDWYKKNKYLIY